MLTLMQLSFLKTQTVFSFSFFEKLVFLVLIHVGYQSPDVGRSFLSSPLLLDRSSRHRVVVICRSWAFSGQMSGLSASEALAFLHHFGSFFHCEPVNVHRIWVSFLSGKRESSSRGLLPLGFRFSSSEDSLHPFEIILEAGGFLEPFFEGLGGGVAAEDLLLEGEREGLSEEVREGGGDGDLGLRHQDPEFSDMLVHRLIARHPQSPHLFQGVSWGVVRCERLLQ